MAEQMKPENIPTGNTFMVGVQTNNNRVLILRNAPLGQSISREYALNLAAWLVAVAAPEEGVFEKLLETVQGS